MNWGKGIAIFLGSFVIFILVLAIKLMSTNVDLVSDDYYQKEIDYSQEMNAVQNSEDLKEKIALNSIDGFFAVQIPEDLKVKNLELKLIRNNNDKLDKSFKIENTHTFLVDKKELVPGIYDAEIHYTIQGEKYLQKQQINF